MLLLLQNENSTNRRERKIARSFPLLFVMFRFGYSLAPAVVRAIAFSLLFRYIKVVDNNNRKMNNMCVVVAVVVEAWNADEWKDK